MRLTQVPNILDRLAVEVFLTPDETPGFRLDSDTLGTGRLGDNVSAEWASVMEDAREVHITRGGERDGVTVAAEVGTLTVTALDSPVLARVRPNTPVRVRRLRDPIGGYGMLPYGDEPYGGTDPADRSELALFTGTVLDLHTSWERLGEDRANIVAVTTLTAVDAVQRLANTARHGVVVSDVYGWDTFETLGDRARRLMAGTGLPWAAPNTAPTDWRTSYRWSSPGFYGMPAERLPDVDGPGWRGFRYYPGEAYDLPVVRRVIATPADSIGQTLQASVWVRVHRASGGLPTPLEARIALGTSPYTSPHVDVDLPADGSWTLVELSRTLASTETTLYVTSREAGAPAGSIANQAGIDVTGLTYTVGDAPMCTGTRYPLGNLVYESTLANHLDVAANTTRGAWWVDGAGTVQVRACRHGDGGQPLVLSDEAETYTYEPPAPPFYEYDYTTSEPFLEVVPLGDGLVRFVALMDGPHTGWSIGSDSNLADGETYEHTITAPGEVWVRVRSDGVLYQTPVTFTAAMLGPEIVTVHPGAEWSYVELQHAYDTAGLVNELTLENHGRQEDPERPATFIADDRNLGPFREHTSTATYGFRAAEVPTGLAYTALLMFAGAATDLAHDYLTISATAQARPSQVRIYRDPLDPPLPPFDVMSPVDIRFRGTTYQCLIAGIEHEVSPHMWHSTLTLVERQ